MRCPFCSKDMEKGFLQSGFMMVWVKKEHLFSLNPKEGEVMLKDRWDDINSAWICKDCKKVIVDYSDKEK